MSKVSQIASMTNEDFIDEVVSGYTYLYAKETFEPLLNAIGENEEDSVVKEALTSAVSTLQFAVMNTVILTVTEFAFTRLAVAGGLTITFLKSTYIAQKVKNIVSGALGAIPFVGRGAGEVVKATSSFLSADRQLIAQMANSTSNNMASIVAKERHTQATIRGYQHSHVNDMSSKAISLKKNSDNKYVVAFQHKTMTGTWLNTAEDKRIYEKATNTQVQSSGTATWSVLYEKLNKYSSFAQTANGEILNNVQASIKLLEKAGAKMS